MRPLRFHHMPFKLPSDKEGLQQKSHKKEESSLKTGVHLAKLFFSKSLKMKSSYKVFVLSYVSEVSLDAALAGARSTLM